MSQEGYAKFSFPILLGDVKVARRIRHRLLGLPVIAIRKSEIGGIGRTPPMIVRVWRAKTYKDKIGEFEKILTDLAIPGHKRRQGCLGFTVGKSLEKDPPEIITVSVWKDLEAMKELTGENWREPVVHPKEAHLIIGKPTTEHYELIDRFSR